MVARTAQNLKEFRREARETSETYKYGIDGDFWRLVDRYVWVWGRLVMVMDKQTRRTCGCRLLLFGTALV